MQYKPWYLWGQEPTLHDLPECPCVWPDCHQNQWANLPLCFDHAAYVAGQMQAMMKDKIAVHLQTATAEHVALAAAADPQPFVYYLMIGPATVKIGTTTRLTERIRELRTDLQYVVALELGGAELEYERHRKFAEERYGRREDFRLSDRLKKHIESLQSQRDELIELAARSSSYRVA